MSGVERREKPRSQAAPRRVGHAHAHDSILTSSPRLAFPPRSPLPLPSPPTRPQLSSPPRPFPTFSSSSPLPPAPFSSMPSDSPNHARASCTSPFSPAFILPSLVHLLSASPQGSRSPSPSGRDVLTLRALVSTKDAGVIIGKGGKNVADLREQTGVKAGVSKVVPGVHERVLSISGSVEAVAKVCWHALSRDNLPPEFRSDRHMRSLSHSSSRQTLLLPPSPLLLPHTPLCVF